MKQLIKPKPERNLGSGIQNLEFVLLKRYLIIYEKYI
jgi:hypothetical protein